MKFIGYVDPATANFFSEMKPEEEGIRPVPVDANHEWTETSMFGFNIPEHDIDCIVYHWHHPALRVTTGGIIIWRGNNTNQVECEYSNYRLVMPMPIDQTNCTYPNGVAVRMLEPLKEFTITFADERRNTYLDLNLRAIMPPACRFNGGHLTQAMKTSGKLILNGEEFKIDGYHSRDRSWNECRTEDSLPLPPISWTVGIIDESFAFHHLSFDDPRHHPEWGGKLVVPDKSCMWGYILEDQKLYGVTATNQHTQFDPVSLRPLRVDTILEATNGKAYKVVGTARATTHVQIWPNMSAHFALFRWEVEGKGIAYGDVQRNAWRDTWRLMSGKDRRALEPTSANADI